MPSSTASRTVAEENRKFQSAWTENYFFVEHEAKPFCLVCGKSIAVPKEYNVRRHYMSKHADEEQLSRSDRYVRLEQLKAAYAQLPGPAEPRAELDALRASYSIAREIASSGHAFTEGEFLKRCMLIAAKHVCPEAASKLETICLSRRTVTRRIASMADFLTEQLIHRSASIEYWSLAMDESTDIQDTAQLLIFIRSVDSSLEVTEELAAMVPMQGTTTGEDVSNEVLKVIEKLKLPIQKMAGCCTDGAPAMIGCRNGALALLEKKLNLQFLKYHCIVHQESLCANRCRQTFEQYK